MQNEWNTACIVLWPNMKFFTKWQVVSGMASTSVPFFPIKKLFVCFQVKMNNYNKQHTFKKYEMLSMCFSFKTYSKETKKKSIKNN